MILGIKMKPSSYVVMTSTKLHQFCPFSCDETQQEVCTSYFSVLLFAFKNLQLIFYFSAGHVRNISTLPITDSGRSL